ncbi:MAG TPA: aminotransferase class IV [Planctomycetota bacterium]|nr:aminotransferase class IV [Planctomycetota bacterium]
MPLLIRIDGATHRDRSTAQVSLYDHGFLFGDSVYEVVRTYGGRPFEVGPHLARLFRSAAGISLDIGRTKEQLAAEIESAVRECACPGEAYVRLIVTRGVGEIDINPATCAKPTIILIVKDLAPWPPEQYERGIDVAIVSTVRNEIGTVDPSIKTGNYLNSVLALIEAKKRGAADACMLNAHGKLTECTTSNIFFVRDGIAHTPSLESGILAGVTRSGVLRIARESGVSVREGSFDADELRRADEAFITSTTRGIMPVATVDGRPVGAGPSARPVTRRLMELFARDVERFVQAG